MPRGQWRSQVGGITQRTSNPSEAHVFARLEAEGYTVLKNGWPDALAVHPDGSVRFIEVKPSSQSRLSPRQARMARALKRSLNVEVEILHP